MTDGTGADFLKLGLTERDFTWRNDGPLTPAVGSITSQSRSPILCIFLSLLIVNRTFGRLILMRQ